MSARISTANFSLPPRDRDRRRQYSRKPTRCQPTTVSGFTTIRTSAHLDQTRRRVVQNSRSTGFKRGRGRFLLSTAICCRRARISRAASCRLQRKNRAATRRAGMNWNTNLACNTDQHHPNRSPASQSQVADFQMRPSFGYTPGRVSVTDQGSSTEKWPNERRFDFFRSYGRTRLATIVVEVGDPPTALMRRRASK